MATIFHDMMHIFMEDYVDDSLSKSLSHKEHLPILAKLFTHLETFKVRLNPKKCTFGIKSDKLLGYIVSTKGVEVDPEKVQAIISMQPPKNLNQLCPLQSRLQSVH